MLQLATLESRHSQTLHLVHSNFSTIFLVVLAWSNIQGLSPGSPAHNEFPKSHRFGSNLSATYKLVKAFLWKTGLVCPPKPAWGQLCCYQTVWVVSAMNQCLTCCAPASCRIVSCLVRSKRLYPSCTVTPGALNREFDRSYFWWIVGQCILYSSVSSDISGIILSYRIYKKNIYICFFEQIYSNKYKYVNQKYIYMYLYIIILCISARPGSVWAQHIPPPCGACVFCTFGSRCCGSSGCSPWYLSKGNKSWRKPKAQAHSDWKTIQPSSIPFAYSLTRIFLLITLIQMLRTQRTFNTKIQNTKWHKGKVEGSMGGQGRSEPYLLSL